jgi:deazaflavin-dependent oxidoreductase (nitroreductase family)
VSEPEQPESQRNEAYTEPPRDKIPAISRMNVAAMETMSDDSVWIGAGMHHVILVTIGRKSGNEHKVALPFWRDPGGRRIVVGSFAGAPAHPSWYLNLTDRTANPEVLVRTQDHAFWADAEILEGAEYDRIWAALTTDRPFYADYSTRTERKIPLVRLVELRQA